MPSQVVVAVTESKVFQNLLDSAPISGVAEIMDHGQIAVEEARVQEEQHRSKQSRVPMQALSKRAPAIFLR